jgi:DNA polymerase I
MNFQNIPRDDPTVKRAIIPKLGALSFFDYSAIEPRLYGYYATQVGHPELVTMVKAGIDPYTAVAQLITEKEEVTKDERQHWKVFFLSLMYGGGMKTIMEQFDCNKKTAWSMIDQFHENLPGVQHLQELTLSQVHKNGHIKGLDGRHLHLEQWGEHKLLNKLIQGGAAAIMKQATIRVHKHLTGRLQSHIVNIVHDDLWIDGPLGELEYLSRKVPELMAHEGVNEVIPIEVEHQWSKTNAAEKELYVP